MRKPLTISLEFSDIKIRKESKKQTKTGQGFVFWKDNDDRNSDQVLKRCQKLDPRVTEWSNKVQNKF